MQLIISSKYLAVELSQIDFISDSVQSIQSEGDRMNIETNERYIVLDGNLTCEPAYSEMIPQEHAGWKEIKKLTNLIDEQPIILEIEPNKVSVTLNY